HVYTREHNAFNSSTRAVLNVHRESMARMGYSPATRVFEAAGARACIITDRFLGVERFLQPRVEVLVADGGVDVVKLLANLSPRDARAIGTQAMRRVLGHHTYDHRAETFEQALEGLWPASLHPSGTSPAALWS
ncbi:MAG TPA: glycosyltransferase, partial [Polyangia bacterium]